VQITRMADRLRVEIGGQLFTEYCFKDVPRPYCYPVIGPGNTPMTRNWPMKAVPGESQDHPHHRSLWFAHGAVNGYDFWSEGKNSGKTVHKEFLEVKSGDTVGVIRSRNEWVAPDGKVVCTDERTLRIHNPAGGQERVLDFIIVLKASNGAITFGDTKEGSFAVRVAEAMRLKGGRGHIVTSGGERDQGTWGKRAAWCDYSGVVEGKAVGLGIFDHPKNPRHPTWWHVRDYGLFAANPFGKHDFEKLSDRSAGDLVIPSGQSATFRYRIYIHEGDEQAGKVAENYQRFVSEPESEL
jgi:hypothetical protein